MSSTRCRICGFKVSVAMGPALLAALPVLLLVFAAGSRLITGAATLAILLVVCSTLTILVQWFFVPLVIDELSNARMVEAGRARIAGQRQVRQFGGQLEE